MTPKVSVVMSVFNAENYLKEAIESILNQSFSDFEFIIVNDGSTDRSLEIIKSYTDNRIILIDQKNGGAANARNTGIKKAKGKYIAVLDADDIAKPQRLQLQYDFLNNNVDYVAIGSNADIIDMDGNYIYTSSLQLFDKEMKNILPEFPAIHPSLMFRKSIFCRAGGYPDFMLKAQDLVMFNRIAKFGKIANIEEPLIKYRIVPTANSNRNSSHDKRFENILSKAIEFDEISEDDYNYLKSLSNNRNSIRRKADYHLFLAKKYLWNNYQPRLARKNLIRSLKINFNKFSIFYYIISFLPGSLIKKLYRHFK